MGENLCRTVTNVDKKLRNPLRNDLINYGSVVQG